MQAIEELIDSLRAQLFWCVAHTQTGVPPRGLLNVGLKLVRLQPVHLTHVGLAVR